MDLKIENIVIKDLESLELALIDFAHIRPYSVYTTDYSVGTREYCPPELKYARLYAEPYLPEMADMFCVGIIMYMILFLRTPFDLKKDYDYHYDCLMSGDYDGFFSTHENQGKPEDGLQAVWDCMAPNPYARPLTDCLLTYPYLTNVELTQDVREELQRILTQGQ